MKTKNLIFSILLLSVLLVGNVSSLDELKPAKLNNDYTILQTCASCSYVNISISSIGGLVETNIKMNNNGSGVWFYIYKPTSVGRHDVTGIGDLSGIDTSFATYFEVTQTGLMQTTSQGISSAIYLLLMLALTTLFLYGGFKLSESEYLWILGIFCMFLFMVFVVYDIWLGYEFHKNLTGMTGGSGIPEYLFYAFMTLLVAGSLTSLGLLFLKWKKLYKYIKNEIQNKKEKDEFIDDFGWGEKFK